MKATIKSIAALAMLAFSAPAIAGGVNVYDDGDSKLKLGGKVFFDGTSTKTDITQAPTAKQTAKTKGFNLGRAYLTAKYYFNSDWMMRVTTDVARETKAGLGKTTNVYLKYAYLEGKLYGKAAVLRVGVSHNPWIDYEQGLWKHRYFTKVTSDEFKYDDSADIGLGMKGKLADGLFGYWVTAVNGGGYGNLTQSNAIDYKSRFGIYPVKGLTIDLGYNTGFRGKKTFKNNLSNNPLKQTMYQVMVTYGTHDFRVGGNWIRNKDKTTKGNSKLATAAGIDANTLALWGWAKLGNGFGLTGRWEQEKSNQINASTGVVGTVDQKRTRYVLGVDYSPVKHVVFTAGYLRDKTTAYQYKLGDTKQVTQIGVWSQFKY